MKYRPDIDGLRALAVLSVLGFHAFPEVFPGGFIGVDIFFVISGYLITSILVLELERQTWSLAGFYSRRVLRIFPALVFVLLTVLLVGWHTLLANEYKLLGKHVAAGAGFVSNFSLWFEAGYFDRASELKPLLHLWSLGVEEQFYIVWPLLLWGAWRWLGRLQGVTLALFLVSLVASAVIVFFDRTQAFYSPLCRAWELMAGAMLAYRMRQTGDILSLMRTPFAQASAFALIVAGVFLLRPEYPFPGMLALVPTVGAVILICADPSTKSGTTTLLSSPFMVAIGLVSYPLYLWHWPLFSFALIFEGGQPSFMVRVALTMTSMVLAVLTYVLLEKPMRHLSRRWSIAGLILCMVIAGMLGANIYKRDGLERIRHKRIIHVDEIAGADFIDFEKTGLITDKTCARPFKFPERDVCLQAHEDKPATAVVLGDSHALHVYWGLRGYFASRGDNLVLLGKGACVPFRNTSGESDPNRCQPHINETLGYIATNQNLRTVVLVFRGRYLSAAASDAEKESFRARMDDTVGLLMKAGKTVVYMMPVVEPDFDPRLCLGNLPLGRRPPFPCTISRREDDKKTQALRAVVDAVRARHPALQILDPNESLCSDGACPIIRDGHSVFKDDNHLSYYGSNLAVRGFPGGAK